MNLKQPKNITYQAVIFTVINYIGVFLGMFSTLFIYPYDKKLLGIFSFIEGFAQILYPIIVMGTSMSLVYFQSQLNLFFQRKLFTYSLFSTAFFTCVIALFVWVLYYLQWFENWQYYFYGFFIAIVLAYIDLSKKQMSVLHKIAFPTAIEKIIPKLALPLVFISVVFAGFSYKESMIFYVFCMIFALLLVLKYSFRQFSPVLTTDFTDLFQQIDRKKYYTYSIYALSASLGSFFAFRIDSIMIPEFLNNVANGEYRLGINIANVLMIPATGIFTLYSPIISQYIKNNEWEKLEKSYKEVAKGLFFIGSLLYVSLLIGVESFFEQLPTASQLYNSVIVIYILGASVLLNMATGFNTEIIAFSKQYTFNLYTILFLACSNVFLNYILLQNTNLGIVAVAFATLISMTLYNGIKMYYIYKKWKIHPFSKQYYSLIIITIVTAIISRKISVFDTLPFDFIFRIMFFIFLYTIWVYRKKHIPYFNQMIDKYLKKEK